MHRPMRDVVREELLEYDLADLLPAEAAVIELYYERFSQSDIAREYGISQATVSRLLRSAMTKQSKKYFSEAA
jgi:RNA polymerase sigma factor (sigma-70 family)